MILIIHHSGRLGNALGNIFFRLGIPCRTTRPMHALSEVSLCFSAVLVCEPECFPDIRDYCRRLRSVSGDLPIFALSAKPAVYAEEDFDAVYDEKLIGSPLVSAMRDTAERLGKHPIGDYRLAGMDLSSKNGTPLFFSKPFPLTKTEAMILRFLIRIYPCAAHSKEILRSCFGAGKMPGESDIRTHVCAINRKFRSLTGQNLIGTEAGGYGLLTPERRLSAKE